MAVKYDGPAKSHGSARGGARYTRVLSLAAP
jgi:hypothetical protein